MTTAERDPETPSVFSDLDRWLASSPVMPVDDDPPPDPDPDPDPGPEPTIDDA